MRIGVTQRSVYVAPQQRGTRIQHRKRPNLALLLLGESMIPAVEQNQNEIINGLDAMLRDVENVWGRI